MARARNIKPGFFANEALAELEAWERLFFIGLWTLADRDGRLENRPRRIGAALFPYEARDVAGAIERLRLAGFVSIYRADGRDLIQIRNWARHQNPHKNEKPSEFPPMDEALPTMAESVPEKIGSARADSLIPDSLIPDEKLSRVRARDWPDPPEWLDADAWREWTEYRRRGKRFTPRAAELGIRTLAELRNAGDDPKSVIEQSIANGWTGLFGIKHERKNGFAGKRGAAERVADAVRRRYGP